MITKSFFLVIWEKKFQEMGIKFGSTFFKSDVILPENKNVLDIDELKLLVSDCFPDLKPQLDDIRDLSASLLKEFL